MIKILLSPSETKLAEALGNEAMVSSIPEEYGADILIYSESGLLGMQRKAVPNDFTSSFTDGRLAQSLPLLVKHCKFFRLVCEGHFKYWPDGTVDLGMTRDRKRVPSRFTRAHIHGMRNDIEFIYGVMIRDTDNLDDTVRYIKSVRTYLSKSKHVGLYSRPSAKGNWYVPTAKDVHLWLLQSFPGIGPSTADAIIAHFSDTVPVQWTCTLEQLMSVSGLSNKRAQELWDSLPHAKSDFEELRSKLRK